MKINNIMLILCILIVTNLVSISFASSGLSVWLEKIGNGENLNEPIFPCPYPAISKQDMAYINKKAFSDYHKKHKYSCRNFLMELDIQKERLPKVPFLKGYSASTISKILSRRKPVLNYFKYDTKIIFAKDSWISDPKYYCKASLNNNYDYLGYIQIKILQLLISKRDLQFKKETSALLDYLCASFPGSKVFDIYKMKNYDARLVYTDLTRRLLFNSLIDYLNLIRVTNGKEKYQKTNIVNQYAFGKDSHYYNLENWREYVKPISEELIKEGWFDIKDPRIKFLYKDRLDELTFNYEKAQKKSEQINQRLKRLKKQRQNKK